jgi:adenylosuccinate synthase
MPLRAIIGAQWGDEGKGKIVDYLGQEAALVARFQGGANAGHTIYIGEEQTILHQIPAGILHPDTHCLLGNGMVIDPVGLVQEITLLMQRGIDIQGRIHLSSLAHIVSPLHKILDAYQESSRGPLAIGTTKRGIGPCYTDKVSRRGLRLGDFFNRSQAESILAEQLSQLEQQGIIASDQREELAAEMEKFWQAIAFILPFAVNSVELVHAYLQAGKLILAEGAQGTLLDIDFGTYPYVTASNTVAGNICTGLGIGPRQISEVIGVYKAYTTRVGSGPFPTELRDKVGTYLQATGVEFGATTRRPRRCGWFDAVLGRYAALLNGFDSIAITKLDVLNGLDKIKICVKYRGGDFPTIDLNLAEPEYIELPGWQQDLGQPQHFRDLPRAAQHYLRTIEELIGVKIGLISLGRERKQILVVD